MKKTVIALLISISFYDTAFAQAAKSVYFELGGPGLASFNFDTRFSNQKDGIGGRIGIGGFSLDNETALFVPLQVNYLLGKDNKNYFELGAGATFVSYNSQYNDDDGTFENSFGHLYFGYRRQPVDGGFLFRAGITPIFNITSGNNFFIPYYFGISFGYAF